MAPFCHCRRRNQLIQLKIYVMKRMLLFIVMLAVIFTACNTRPGVDEETLSAYTDTAGFAAFQEWKFENERKDASEYMKPAAPAKTVRQSTPAKSTSGNTTTVPTQQKAKKGWSKAAKGTAIGTATGAAAGAIINKKNRVVGGVIGGVVGGSLGYIIGRKMDKKDGRVS